MSQETYTTEIVSTPSQWAWPGRQRFVRRLPGPVPATPTSAAFATDADVAKIYPPDTHRRLTKVKQRFDPRNMFGSTC